MYEFMDPKLAMMMYKERINGRREQPIVFGRYGRPRRAQVHTIRIPQFILTAARAVTSWLL
jgi:hypothetical protein